MRTGTLEISADVPGARVIVDGRAIGPAPQKVADLSAGPHDIRVEKDGLSPYEQQVHVIPGRSTPIRARLPEKSAAPASSRPELRIESDVPGAQVFVDREFRGTAPLVLRDLAPGSHRVNASADGYDMQAQEVEIGAAPVTVQLAFKRVALDESLQVVHKHGLGSCDGRLSATLDGLRYEPAGGDHRLAAPLASLQVFEMQYLDKKLRVKAAGRAFDFTTRDRNADALFAFHAKVSAARKRSASR